MSIQKIDDKQTRVMKLPEKVGALPYYFHTPGEVSKGAVLDLGLRCPHSCKFCYYSFFDASAEQFAYIRKARYRTWEDCKAILLRLGHYGYLHMDITGGEPTLHPHIVEIVRYAQQELGISTRIITLGQFLLNKGGRPLSDNCLDALLKAGLTDFLFSIHATEEEYCQRFTGGSWQRQHEAMQRLDNLGFQYGVNTVVFAENYQLLPQMARTIANHGVYIHNFIIFNAYHHWARARRGESMQAGFSKIYPYLCEAVTLLQERGIAVNIRYAPLCVFPGLQRHLVGIMGVPYDPFEWRNRAGNFDKSPEFCAIPIDILSEGYPEQYAFKEVEDQLENGVRLIGMRGDHLKVFAEPCKHCQAQQVCDGIDPNYLLLHGTKELSPYAAIDVIGPLLKERLEYVDPFFVKLQSHADMKTAINRPKTEIPFLSAVDQCINPLQPTLLLS